MNRSDRKAKFWCYIMQQSRWQAQKHLPQGQKLPKISAQKPGKLSQLYEANNNNRNKELRLHIVANEILNQQRLGCNSRKLHATWLESHLVLRIVLVSREHHIKDQRDHASWNQGWEPRNPSPKSSRKLGRASQWALLPYNCFLASSNVELPWKLLQPKPGVIVFSSPWWISLTLVFSRDLLKTVFSATTQSELTILLLLLLIWWLPFALLGPTLKSYSLSAFLCHL